MTPNRSPAPRGFPLGRTVITQGARAELGPGDLLSALRRHSSGDWGDLDAADKARNDDALLHGDRLLSSYRSGGGVKFYVITEADRSYTTILLPQEY